MDDKYFDKIWARYILKAADHNFLDVNNTLYGNWQLHLIIHKMTIVKTFFTKKKRFSYGDFKFHYFCSSFYNWKWKYLIWEFVATLCQRFLKELG